MGVGGKQGPTAARERVGPNLLQGMVWLGMPATSCWSRLHQENGLTGIQRVLGVSKEQLLLIGYI